MGIVNGVYGLKYGIYTRVCVGVGVGVLFFAKNKPVGKLAS